MLGIDRRVLSAAWTLFLFALVLAVLYTIGHTLVLFALALFLAHLLGPVVEFVYQFFPRKVPRVAALAIVYLLLIGILAALGATLVPKVAEQAAALASRLPDAIKTDPLAHIWLPAWLEPVRDKVNQLLMTRVQDLEQDFVPILTGASKEILSGIGSLLSLILIPILSFFFIKDAKEIREAFVETFDPGAQPMVNEVLEDLHALLANYIRALVLLSFASFVSMLIFLSAVSAPFPVLLAGVAALLELIPVVGPLTAAVIIITVSAFTGFPHLLWLVVFLALYRVFQDYVLNPYLMSSGVEIHPVLVLFGVVAGDQIAGIPGMFFSVPVIAALRLLLTRVRKHYVVE
jgi:predicted PurR-regulated permease PerM